MSDVEGAVRADAPAPAADVPSVAELDLQRCRALLAILTSIVWVCDGQGRVVSPQASWSVFTGQPWPQPENNGWIQAVRPEDRERLNCAYQEAMVTRTAFLVECGIWHAATQKWRQCEIHAVPVLAPGGEVLEWLGTCTDVEERWQAQQALIEQDRRKDEFIAVLAHELRNPLAPIRNAVQVLKLRGNGDMQLAWARAMIERQVANMAHLLDDLLDMSRIRQNKLELHKSRVTLDSVLDAAIEASRPN